MADKKIKVTPMMKQYGEIKAKNPDTLLLYRMGDFYELFNHDAEIASKVLGLTLTARNHGGADKTPLAGFPHHALDRYANKLVHAGYKIAICEQVEDPKMAKGLVKRDVVEIITAGTATDDSFIDEKVNNFIAAIKENNGSCGLSVCDLSTGEFIVSELSLKNIVEELTRIDPAELLLPNGDSTNSVEELIRNNFPSLLISTTEGWKFDEDHATDILKEHFSVASVAGMGLEGYTLGVCSSGALLEYLKFQKKNKLKHILKIQPAATSGFAKLDPSTIRNLELLKPLQTEDRGGTLISVLDKTATSMGARLLRKWITRPLKDISKINSRLDSVEWLKNDVFVRGELQIKLRGVADIERLISRITFERANARDLVALKRSLHSFPSIIKSLSESKSSEIKNIAKSLEGFDEIADKISTTIVEEPPLTIKEGGIIRTGISSELDEYKDASANGKKWIAQLQVTERERTGISTAKVKYNKVFGYYIEVSKANLNSIPDNYIRKQTLVNAERFITPELKEMESKILGAEEKLSAIEYEIFLTLRESVAKHCDRIQQAAEAIAKLDIFVSLGRISADNRYCRPTLNATTEMKITEGRHPVVEQMDPAAQFVPNDATLNHDDSQILLITGPNMAGKSTYLRQNALIAIMAQMGSFVPADSADIGIVDRFFTRVGASDRLARGQSTFLVEMIEVANILNNATDRSLVLLDEVGRGTSTFDGISIAWAVAEFLHNTKAQRARTFFATHYHELTELPLLFPAIKNLHIKVKEWNDKIIFLRKIGEGSCDHSYGIQVARLAGVPVKVINRSKEILANLESMELTPEHRPVLARHHTTEPTKTTELAESAQVDLFAPIQMNALDASKVELISQLQNLNVNSLTPLDAINLLAELKEKADII